jgi:hypothetical protein
VIVDFVDTMPTQAGGLACPATLLGLSEEFVIKGKNDLFNFFNSLTFI